MDASFDYDFPEPVDIDLGGFDWDGPPDTDPPEPRPERSRQPRSDDWNTLSWAIVASVALLGLLKLLFLLSAGWLATLISAITFVAAHGLFIMGGASLFWSHRYDKD